jgi:uncharacterized protein (DUF433 family)
MAPPACRLTAVVKVNGRDAAAVYSEAKDSAMSNKPAVVHIDPEILGGTPVFIGTRVLAKTLFDYLEAGDPLDDFLNDFPSVSREQAVAALELAREMTESHAAVTR